MFKTEIKLPAPSAVTLAHGDEYTPLAQVQRTHVDTNAAAHYLNRRPQTLRGWHCHGHFPIESLRPVAVNGRLAWSVAAIKSVMKVTA